MSMKKLWTLCVVVVAILGCSRTPGLSGQNSYSADVIAKVGRVESKIKLYVSGAKSRCESESIKTVMIFRKDIQRTWILSPDRKTYTESKLMPDMSLTYDTTLETNRHFLGEETIDGKKAAKYRIDYSKDGRSFQLYQWFIKGLSDPVKTASLDGDMIQEFQNIHITPLPASLFDIPPDYKKHRLPGDIEITEKLSTQLITPDQYDFALKIIDAETKKVIKGAFVESKYQRSGSFPTFSNHYAMSNDAGLVLSQLDKNTITEINIYHPDYYYFRSRNDRTFPVEQVMVTKPMDVEDARVVELMPHHLRQNLPLQKKMLDERVVDSESGRFINKIRVELLPREWFEIELESGSFVDNPRWKMVFQDGAPQIIKPVAGKILYAGETDKDFYDALQIPKDGFLDKVILKKRGVYFYESDKTGLKYKMHIFSRSASTLLAYYVSYVESPNDYLGTAYPIDGVDWRDYDRIKWVMSNKVIPST